MWLRWYEQTTEDTKFKLVAHKAATSIPNVIATWAMLLEDARRPANSGTATRGVEYYAINLGIEPEIVATILKIMVDTLMIDQDENGIRILKWGERQFETDSLDPTNNERKRRFRERQKVEKNGTETWNGSGTDQERPDTEADPEIKKKKLKKEKRSETVPEIETEPDLDAEFHAWFRAYPLKRDVVTTKKAYLKARKTVSAEALFAGVERYKLIKPAYADWKYPATWLNGGCWMDEPAPKAVPPKKKTIDVSAYRRAYKERRPFRSVETGEIYGADELIPYDPITCRRNIEEATAFYLRDGPPERSRGFETFEIIA